MLQNTRSVGKTAGFAFFSDKEKSCRKRRSLVLISWININTYNHRQTVTRLRSGSVEYGWHHGVEVVVGEYPQLYLELGVGPERNK